MKSRKRKDKELKFTRLFSFSSRPRLSTICCLSYSLALYSTRRVTSNLSDAIRLARIIFDARRSKEEEREGEELLQISTLAPLNY